MFLQAIVTLLFWLVASTALAGTVTTLPRQDPSNLNIKHGAFVVGDENGIAEETDSNIEWDNGDGSGANTYFLNVTPNNSELVGSAYQKIGARVFYRITSGEQTKLARAFHGQLSIESNATHSGSGANSATGFWFSGVHNSTGTVAEIRGGSFQATVLAAGSVVNTGATGTLEALDLRVGYGSTGGSGSINEAYGVFVDFSGVNSTHTVETMTGLYIEDASITGVTHPYAINTEGGEVRLWGGQTRGRVSISSDATIDEDTFIIGVDTSVARSLVIPEAASLTNGKMYCIKDETGSAGANNITISTEGSHNIDGLASYTINSNRGKICIYSDGTNWHIIS